MSNLFNLENPFFQFMSKLCDIIMLSIVYTILCLPLFTIGPATTAMYYTVVKVIRRERGYVFREFFRSFKENFKSGLFLTLVLALFYAILYIDRKYALHITQTKGSVGFILYCVFNAVGVFLIMTTIYVFPILSRFTIKGFQVLKTSFFMSIKHLPSTILMAGVFMCTIILLYVFVVPFLIVPALGCLLISFPMERIFKKYMPQTEGDPEKTGKDEWYLE